MQLTFLVSRTLSVLTIFADIIVVALLITLIIGAFTKKDLFASCFKKIKAYSLHIILLVSSIALIGSLYFSEIAQYEPCKLCWIQRIFMYPLVLLSAMAIARKDMQMRVYALVMSSIGMVIAGYHYAMQVQTLLFPNSTFTLSCNVVGYAPSCSEYFTLQFGYVTIPMMAFSAFLLMTTVLAISLRKK